MEEDVRFAILQEAKENGGVYNFYSKRKNLRKDKSRYLLLRGLIAELEKGGFLTAINNSQRYSLTSEGEKVVELGSFRAYDEKINPVVESYKFGDNTIIGSTISDSNVNQESLRDLKNPSIIMQNTQATQPHQSPLKNQTTSINDSKSKSNIPGWAKSILKYIILPLAVLFIWWLILTYGLS